MYQLAPYVLLGLSWAGQLVSSRPSCSSPKVKLANGTYEGVHSREYRQDYFLGMPYAKPAERFTVAQGLDREWEGVRDAKEYPKHCIGYGYDQDGFEQSEDCLYLNVVRPSNVDEEASLPVAVWIHGGGLVMGGSADKRYNLSFIVDQSVQMGKPIIGVSLNYRLSAFGFLNGKVAIDEGVANIGFRDQRLALHWVRENIQAFGGDRDKVTIWGESSGAESVTAQALAYNGRDDGLFRAAIGQSGFGGFLPRLPGGFNATGITQGVYDTLVGLTSCAPLVGSSESLECLREAPFEEIDAALVAIGPLVWPPAIDGDFFTDYLTNQLDSGRFVQVPLLAGTNTDEGTGFGRDLAGSIDTDEEFAAALARFVVSDYVEETTEELIAQLMELYPNDQSVGIPSLETWPHVIQPGDEVAQEFGAQFRRVSAIVGDVVMHYTRRRANLVWTANGIPNWSYRFDIVPNGQELVYGAVHYQEVAFVFKNLNGDGYANNPFGGSNEEYSSKAKEVAEAMSSAWINFITGLNPNGDGLPNSISWPGYGAATNDKTGQNIVWDLDESVAEKDDWREEGISWFIEHALTVWGS